MLIVRNGIGFRELDPSHANLDERWWAAVVCCPGEAHDFVARGWLDQTFAAGAEVVMVAFVRAADMLALRRLIAAGPSMTSTVTA